MVLRRSGSAKSTLSMMTRRATKYQRFLNFSNVFLLIVSTFLMFSAAILMKFYHIDKLYFWSAYFQIVPLLMIVLGVYTFLLCVYGFIISNYEHRPLLAIYAVLLIVAFVAQLGSIFTALELRTTVVHGGSVPPASVVNELNRYGVDSATTANWDELQRDLHCCGGSNFNTGYEGYRNTPIGANNSVPDSCCHEVREGCGNGILRQQVSDVRNKIFVDGCITILKDKLETDVLPMMIVYAVIGVILGLVELITVVLACAYVAQITRKRRREDKMWRMGNAGDDGAAAPDEMDNLRSSRGETVC